VFKEKIDYCPAGQNWGSCSAVPETLQSELMSMPKVLVSRQESEQAKTCLRRAGRLLNHRMKK
jgi:hypothetical protein